MNNKEELKFLSVAWVKRIFRMKMKFAMTSSVATVVDYILYLTLHRYGFAPVIANTISHSIAMIINFFLQKKFVFALERKAYAAFVFAIVVSLGGLVISNFIIYGLNMFSFFEKYQFITKLCATGIVFFYNFYFKRYVFEKRFVTFKEGAE